MAIIYDRGLPVNDPRGNDQNRENSHPGNAPAYLLDEGEDIEDIITGKISSLKNEGEEIEGNINKLEGLNSDRELIKKIRQDAEKPNVHPFENKDY